jgi:deazaflavin-dependent oxidoreductase (nitroreductase family)
MINRLGATPAGVWVIKNLISPIQRWIYRGSRGRLLPNLGSGRNVLLLTTKGRRTGKDRTIPVFYLRDGDAVVICNVRPESERGTNPWVINLRSHPVAQLQIGSDTAKYCAREATADEINRLWPRLIGLWPANQAHHERGGRRIVFILERARSLRPTPEAAQVRRSDEREEESL